MYTNEKWKVNGKGGSFSFFSSVQFHGFWAPLAGSESLGCAMDSSGRQVNSNWAVGSTIANW